MTVPAVVETPDASMTKLIAVMRLRRISALPIVAGGELVGLVSTTDVLHAPSTAHASDVMSKVVVTVGEEESVDDAGRRFTPGRVHHLVVLSSDGRRITGMLSPHDVIQVMQNRRVIEPIASIMTTPVETVDIGDSIAESVRRLARAQVHGLVVVDGERPVGVFTHTEALAARKLPGTLSSTPVEAVMSYETICIDRLTPIYRAAAYIARMALGRILVVEHRRLVGLVSALDIVDVLARAPEVWSPANERQVSIRSRFLR